MTLLALLLLVTATWALGHGATRRLAHGSDSIAHRLVISWITGLLLLYLLLLGLDLLGVPWHPATVGPALVAAVVISWRLSRGKPLLAVWGEPPGWGDAVALAAFGVYAACTALLWNLHPDFIYHWGIKSAKFALAGGLDFDYLAAPWNGHIHPDYPNLLPSLYALTAILGGSRQTGTFTEVPMALWSALFFALMVLAAGSLLRRLGVSNFARQAGVATLALTLLMFGVGFLQAGGADWLIALAVLAGAMLLTSRPGSAKPGSGLDLQMGVVAAFAAAAKIEGIALAAWLVAAHVARSWQSGHRSAAALARVAALSALPALLVVGLWAWQVQVHGLFQATNTGSLDLGRAGVVVAELARSLLTVNWHGLTLCLVALPLLLADRRLRWPAAVCCLQLAFYVYAYLAASVDVRHWIATSAPRLYFHLVPAALVLLVAALDRWFPQRGFDATMPAANGSRS